MNEYSRAYLILSSSEFSLSISKSSTRLLLASHYIKHKSLPFLWPLSYTEFFIPLPASLYKYYISSNSQKHAPSRRKGVVSSIYTSSTICIIISTSLYLRSPQSIIYQKNKIKKENMRIYRYVSFSVHSIR